jgi:Ser-tRNA(Ala) deacylase AlaX
VVGKAEGFYEFKESIFHLQGGGQPNDRGWVAVGQDKIEIVGGTIERESGRVSFALYSYCINWGRRLKSPLERQ